MTSAATHRAKAPLAETGAEATPGPNRFSMPQKSSAIQQLTEHFGNWRTKDLQVDRESRMVRNIALARSESKNGYHYCSQALKEAVPLYAEKPVFLDHSQRAGAPHQRSTRDLVGSIVNPRFVDGVIRGEIRVLDTEAGRTFLALVESNGPAVGMSHVVMAERNTDHTIVEHIADVVSVDAVVFPASTTNFQESRLAQAAPVNALDSQLETDRRKLQQEIEALKTEREQLAAEVDVERRLQAADLPAFAVTEVFREQLRTSRPDRRQDLINERLSLLQSQRREPATATGHSTVLLNEHQRPSSSLRQPMRESISDAALVLAVKLQR